VRTMHLAEILASTRAEPARPPAGAAPVEVSTR
jgi:L-lactate dehydrogenase complex protein LldE